MLFQRYSSRHLLSRMTEVGPHAVRPVGGILGKVGFRGTTMIFALAMLSLTACEKEPVQWSDISYHMAVSAGPSSSETGDSADGQSSLATGGPIPIHDLHACWPSIRLARAEKSFYAAWWSVRPDSSASLDVSRSDDGADWTKPVIADSTDASSRGCNRPPPAVVADILSGYVHLAYFIEPASGAGVFSVHTMDRGETFHSPVPIVFNDQPSRTSIAAEGDRVAVAYDQPVGERSQVFVALSKTAGHLFNTSLPVSAENANASDPRAILHGTKLELSWTEHSSADSTHLRLATRTGTWK